MKKLKRLRSRFLSLGILIVLALSLLGAIPVLAVSGTGPDDARTIPNDWEQLNPGKTRWYAFQYAGDGSQVNVRLQIVPDESASFAIWTPGDVHEWSDGREPSPVGHGSLDPTAEGTLVWSGSFTAPGTYYVVVEHSGSQPGPSYYLLEVQGDGVSLAPAAPTSPTLSEPTKTQPKATKPTKPSGKLVFQSSYGGGLHTINVDGSDLRRITDGVDPIWSPNGQQIAFARWREPRGIWIIDADGAGEWRVFDWDRARWPSWSPDASEILFSRMTGAGRQDDTEFCFRGFCFAFPAHPHWRLGIAGLDGSFQEPSSSEISHAPMWSPDGQQVVYDDNQGLRIQTTDGSVSYMITDDPKDTAPAWSPDGQRVAFVRRQHDHWEVYVVGADGRNVRRLTNTPLKPNGQVGHSAAPAWSPDGQHIAFFTDRNGKWEIWVTRANGTEQRPMFEDELDGLRLDYSFQSERAISWSE